jgi:hypothetical protein
MALDLETKPDEAKGIYFDALQKLKAIAGDETPRDTDPATGLPRTAKILVEGGAKVVEDQAAAPLSDEDIYNKVAAFLDSTYLGPPFVSKPIRGKIFFGIYPRQREVLNSTRITGTAVANMPEQLYNALTIIGELRETCRGWLPEHHPGVQTVLCNLDKPERWPKMRPIDFLETRDPHTFDSEVMPLWADYAAWKKRVEPTEEEFVKYYSRID